MADGPSQFETISAELLIKYWRPPGVVNGIRTVVFDFKSKSDDAQAKDSLFGRTLQALEATDLSQLKTSDDGKALWIMGARLSEQLDALARSFLSNSWIFEKDADVIERDLGGWSTIVHHYPDPATCDGFECHGSIFVCSFERDWTLNDTALTHNTSRPHA